MNSKIKILSVVKRKDLDETKEIFKSVIEKLCEADLSEILKIGEPTQIPNQFLFVLEVEKNIAVEVIKQLTYSGIAIVKNDPSIRAAVAEANFEIENQQANTIQRIKKEDSVKNKLQKRGNYSVEELAFLRDWQLMVEVALNQSGNDIDKGRKIIELLPEILNETIEKEIELGARSLGAAKNSIEKLLAVTENETLKRFHFVGSIKKAGEAVINLCSQHQELTGDLIFLANSTSTLSIINVKSFLAFYKFISEEPEKYEYEINVAIRHLNTRALDTVHLVAADLNNDEKVLFNKGIEFFRENRKKI